MEVRRKTSVKRQAIMDALCASKEHPSAEMLYEQLKLEIPDLSFGTIYRNLSIFTQEGSAQVVCHVNGKERFDGRTDPHAHLICKSCNKVSDIEGSMDLSSFIESFSHSRGFIPESWALTFSGVCPKCSAGK